MNLNRCVNFYTCKNDTQHLTMCTISLSMCAKCLHAANEVSQTSETEKQTFICNNLNSTRLLVYTGYTQPTGIPNLYLGPGAARSAAKVLLVTGAEPPENFLGPRPLLTGKRPFSRDTPFFDLSKCLHVGLMNDNK